MEYSILIADDEEIIRKGFIARLEYLEIEPKKIYEASDGFEALEVMKEKKPEIVIVDIRMPYMDGLELIRCSKEQKIVSEFVILSGYAEFSYAEQAIQMGVNAYLLKPISNERLRDVLTNVCKKLDEKKKLLRTIVEKDKMYKVAQDMNLERRLNEIFHSQETVKRKEKTDGEKKYVTFIINIDGNTFENNYCYNKDIELVKFTVINIFNELNYSGNKFIVNNLANLSQLIAVMTGEEEKMLRQETGYFLMKLINITGRQMSIFLTIGISGVNEEISKVSYKEACDAFVQRMVGGLGNVYFYENIQALSKQSFPKTELEMLNRYINRSGGGLDIGNIEILLSEIFSKERMQPSVTDYVSVVWIEILNSLLKVTNQSMADMNDRFDNSVLQFEEISHFNDVEQLIQYMCSVIVKFVQPSDMTDMKSRNKIKLAVRYIEEHYNSDLSITDLAYKYAMSPNYFSTSFKKETGLTIVNYVKKLRMEKAFDLLTHTNYSVMEISLTIGYTDSQYFFRVFKKELGMTPLQYRKKTGGRGKNETGHV